MSRAFIGIDFGTTNSAIAHVIAGGETAVIPDPTTNQKVLPSVVYFESPNRVVVGEKARDVYYEVAESNYSHIFKSIKRRLKQNRTFSVFGRQVTTTEIAGHIFSELKYRADRVLQEEVESAVVTVPVYFDSEQKRIIREAAEFAGMQVEGFLHEPVAVVYRYCQDIDYTQYLLVLDWGGGTLDITVLRIDDGIISELEVGGDEALGGDDLDMNLATNVFDRFLSNSKLPHCELGTNPVCCQRLVSRAETAKIQLSSPEVHETPIDILNFYNNQDLSHVVTRSEFENTNQGIFEAVFSRVNETLQKVRLTPKDIDQVVLAGGSSQIPLLVKRMEGFFGARKIRTMPNAETCTAEGAALVSRSSFKPVLSVPIGIQLDGGLIHTFIQKGTSIYSKIYKDFQLLVSDPRYGTANIKVFESETGKPEAPDTRIKQILQVPVNPKFPEKVRVEFLIDENQCLTISAAGLETKIKERCHVKDVKVGFKMPHRR